ncbi:MAG: hypothetical protein Q9162_006236, partial [Coniocarpon cinnabarinum]
LRPQSLFRSNSRKNAGTLLDYVLHAQHAEQPPSLAVNGRRASLVDSKTRDSGRLSNSRRLPLEDILSFFKDITSGLAHLHANNYVHRDLKPQNCLLHRSGNTLRALVSDFGEMQGASVQRSPEASGYTGTISFTAPEILSRDLDGKLGDFTFKSDVFSLGMIMFFMCFGRLPYSNANLEDEAKEDVKSLRSEVLAWRGMRQERKERADLPDKFYEYLQLLLSHDPHQRPSTEDILRRMPGRSSFHDHGATSPVSDRFPSPDFGFHKEKSTSPEPGSTNSWSPSTPSIATPMMRTASADAPKTATVKRRMPRRSSTDVSPGGPSPTNELLVSNATVAQVRPHVQQRMLMPPPNVSMRQRVLSILVRPEFASMVKLLLFFAKMWTLLTSCSPRLPKTGLLYPLLAIAALDLTGFTQGIWSSLHNSYVCVEHVPHRKDHLIGCTHGTIARSSAWINKYMLELLSACMGAQPGSATAFDKFLAQGRCWLA